MSNLFQREVYCVLGVPIDCVNLGQAADKLCSAIERDERLVLATPNLNFLILAQNDAAFRSAIVNCDLCIADGMPLIWIARCLGIPARQRVAGSDLMDYLSNRETARPAEIFFFGGDEGIGDRACEALNRRSSGGLHACGSFYPGFGSPEEMDDSTIIDAINGCNPDILAVALGANKGHAWIERNHSRLNARVISHLGAVINFFAGSVSRAPVWMQKTGLEWCWRIAQEPKLWRRYWHDGRAFLRLVLTRVLPLLIWSKLFKRRTSANETAEYTYIEQPERNLIQLRGPCEHQNLDPVRAAFARAAAANKNCHLDLSGVPQIDNAFLGQLLVLRKLLGERELRILNPSPLVRRIFRWNCAEFLLSRADS
jgi:N-acetylglucosaminyldiphosphoundecaprenol N-acetyl-beta-D-mannosaminyltransferase